MNDPTQRHYDKCILALDTSAIAMAQSAILHYGQQDNEHYRKSFQDALAVLKCIIAVYESVEKP